MASLDIAKNVPNSTQLTMYEGQYPGVEKCKISRERDINFPRVFACKACTDRVSGRGGSEADVRPLRSGFFFEIMTSIWRVLVQHVPIFHWILSLMKFKKMSQVNKTGQKHVLNMLKVAFDCEYATQHLYTLFLSCIEPPGSYLVWQ